MRKFWAEVIDCLMDMAIAFECLVTRQWNGLPVTYVAEVKPEEQHPKTCSRADLSAAAILEFVKAQKKPTTVFDEYVAAEKRREVMSDE
jgi:hypothetical protein